MKKALFAVSSLFVLSLFAETAEVRIRWGSPKKATRTESRTV